MKISELAVSALAKIITGDGGKSPYKSGPVLVKFFNEFGYKEVYGQGFPSRWTFAEDKIRGLNGKPSLSKPIETAVNRRSFLGTEFDVTVAVGYLEHLKYDGYQLIDDGMFDKCNRCIGPDRAIRRGIEYVQCSSKGQL